ncbi:MAG: chromosome segregation protein SMC [Asgard group archaeon]|nr:chromosome segregation protein SMC [Asgard group archaeon]
MVHITRLVLENFKSYGKRKITLNLDMGLTVISGPNGCGKSNISDAIQFVIGQLRGKSIRSEKLSGVIFSGTKEGQKTAPYSRVTLVLDNSKEPKEIPISTDEVHISRKVYLDGRSEYSLNGSRITRNEIIDTMAICGISIDGFNVIRQGEIANFANMSSLQVRALFEEIAGIAAYDEKKGKAQKNLEDARTKLKIASVRLDESMKNLERLEKEKEDALRYQELKVRIKNTEAKLIHARIRQLKDRIGESETKIKDLKEAQQNSEKTIEQIEESIKSYDDLIADAKAKVKDATTQSFNTLTGEIEEITKKLSQEIMRKDQIETELFTLKQSKESIKEQLDKILEENEELEKFTTSTKDQLTGADDTLKKIREELDVKRQMLESSRTGEIMDQLEEIRINTTELNKRKAEFESQLAIFNNNLNINNSRVDEKEKRVVEVAGILATFSSRKAKYLEEINSYDKILRDLQVKANESKEELETVEVELADNEENLRDVALSVKRIQTEVETTKKIMDEVTSRDRGIKLVLQARDDKKINGIFGTVGELCKTHPKYSIALNVTAGNRTDYIVVKDDEVAANCMVMIKKAKAGRVTFLPLNKLNPMVINPKLSDKGVVGRALDLVEFDEKYRKAIEFVFGQTLIVKNLDAARRIGFNYRAVTLDGDVVYPSGMMTGGFYKGKDKAKISLIVEDEKLLPQLEQEFYTLQEERNRLLEYRTEINQELNEEILPKLNEMRRNYDLKQRDISSLEEEINLRSSENLRILHELEELTTEHEDIEVKIEDLLRSRKDVSISLETILEAEIRLKEELNKSGVQGLLEGIKAKESQQQEIGEIISNLQMEHFKTSTNLEKNLEQVKELRKGIEAFEKQEPSKISKIEKIQTVVDGFENELTAKKQKRDELFNLIEESQNKQEQLELEQRELREQLETERKTQNQNLLLIDRLVNEKATLDVQIKEFEDLAVERDLPYIFAEDEVIDVDVLREVMNGLKAELDSLPEINMKAVSQFDEEQELNQELLEKKRHVEKDYEAINQAINEIESEKRDKFMGVFVGISKDFNRIFGILSPDGRARIELEDKDDPFAGGLHIMANPGGKKIISMLSLSGGEKSLTALAMIFAIQRYKPAPFYIFDEIDAFLDINNVNKVATLVREMSRDTQMVIISLRAPMIAAAEKIYGVTAGEDRISQIVSVSLDEIMKIVEKTDLPSEVEVYDY